ncbi:MAG TPA: exosortase/archaeosortase family protein [Gemmatimonadales bacterium]|nr:exosortase/archaeosortase family protein [Gemmatimonadales bacterium]
MTAWAIPQKLDWRGLAPFGLTALFFAILFAQPFTSLAHDWCTDPDAGHGLLLFPLALWLGWRAGRITAPQPQRVLGLIAIVGAVALRCLGGLAAELFTQRVAMLGAFCGVVVFFSGIAQIKKWWLPLGLVALSIPLPAVILGSLALPLQFKASQLGAHMLASRHVPVALSGNVIHLPGRDLFVTEACSGLHSLTALISLGVLAGGLWLATIWGRVILVGAAIPVAMLLNGIRIFLTGFLVFYIDPKLADGFLHLSEGWAIFVVAFAILAGFAWLIHFLERRRRTPGGPVEGL